MLGVWQFETYWKWLYYLMLEYIDGRVEEWAGNRGLMLMLPCPKMMRHFWLGLANWVIGLLDPLMIFKTWHSSERKEKMWSIGWKRKGKRPKRNSYGSDVGWNIVVNCCGRHWAYSYVRQFVFNENLEEFSVSCHLGVEKFSKEPFFLSAVTWLYCNYLLSTVWLSDMMGKLFGWVW